METVALSDVNIGNLDMTETNGGTVKAELSLADNQTDRDGNEVTGWHNAVCYGSTAEFVERNAQPGRRVSVSGTRNYWEYEGETYSAIDIDSIRFVDSPDESSGGFGQSSGSGSSGQSSGNGGGNAGGDHFDPGEEDDDLPF
jgi:single-stranded DNA-binding protein